MAKAAVLKKVDMKQLKKSSAKSIGKTAKPPAAKKPVLKVVKSSKPAAKKAPQKAARAQTPAKKTPVKIMAKKATAMKITTARMVPAAKASAKPAVKTMVAKPVLAKPVAVTPRPALSPAKTNAQKFPVKPTKSEFRVGDHVVYPTHGVGKILAEETQVIGEVHLRMLVIAFEKDRMTLRVPVSRAGAAGLRHISGTDQMQQVFVTLKGRAKISRGMWSRRAQEYEAKINSGNVHSIAEVVRDLHHNVDQAERSYSERMIYESALNRLVGELAAAEGTDQKTANDKLMKLLRAKVTA